MYNKGGGCDFIYQNSLSKNVALIEIKTPCTQIIGDKYRGTFIFTKEFSCAVNQVINYGDRITYSLSNQYNYPFNVITP